MRRLLLPLLVSALSLVSCTAPQGGGTLDTQAFQLALATPGAQLIDVRTPAEYAEGHIDGAVNLDWTGGVLEQQKATLDKIKPVLLYCASSRRSAAAREALSATGFSDVKDLSGGITTWRNAVLPVK